MKEDRIKIGEEFEEKVYEELKAKLPKDAIILRNMYFITDGYINSELGYKTVQMDIIVICKGVFVIECKFLTNEKYSKIENCKTDNKKYKGRLCAYRFVNGKETRIKKSLYGLNQNESHYRFLRDILIKRFGFVTIKAITVFGGISKDKLKIKKVKENNYIYHEFDLVGCLKWALDTWSFAPINEKNVAEFLSKIELKDIGREEVHIKQVEYFLNTKISNYSI